jgi:hypothetical protein
MKSTNPSSGRPAASKDSAPAKQPASKPTHEQTVADDAPLQGEGNYAAARRYREDATRHAQTHDVNAEARDAAPKDAQQAAELRRAEEEGKRHAKK